MHTHACKVGLPRMWFSDGVQLRVRVVVMVRVRITSYDFTLHFL